MDDMPVTCGRPGDRSIEPQQHTPTEDYEPQAVGRTDPVNEREG